MYYDFDCTIESLQDEMLDTSNIAEEGFLFTTSTEENIDELKRRDKCLCIFTSSGMLKYGGINERLIKNLTSKYSFKKYENINLMEYIMKRISKDPNKKYDVNCTDAEIIKLLDDIEMSEKDFTTDIVTRCIKALDNYSVVTQKLICAVITIPRLYSMALMRSQPIIIADASLISSFFKSSIAAKNPVAGAAFVASSQYSFKVLDNKIPTKMIVKGSDIKFPLYHVSPNKEIKELVPRVTVKPMRGENVRIARISCAPSIDGCFRAVGLKTDSSIRYYVYRLQLDPQARVVRPTPQLVPDRNMTDEYWVLDPTPVENLGYITVTLDKKANRYRFDDSKVKVPANITTTFTGSGSWKM